MTSLHVLNITYYKHYIFAYPISLLLRTSPLHLGSMQDQFLLTILYVGGVVGDCVQQSHGATGVDHSLFQEVEVSTSRHLPSLLLPERLVLKHTPLSSSSSCYIRVSQTVLGTQG